MSRHRRHNLVIEILCDDTIGQRQAQDKVHYWLETFGHADNSFGFKFVSVGVLTGKRLSNAPSLSNNRKPEDAQPKT